VIKNSQPFGKKVQKTVGEDFFDSHCMSWDGLVGVTGSGVNIHGKQL